MNTKTRKWKRDKWRMEKWLASLAFVFLKSLRIGVVILAAAKLMFVSHIKEIRTFSLSTNSFIIVNARNIAKTETKVIICFQYTVKKIVMRKIWRSTAEDIKRFFISAVEQSLETNVFVQIQPTVCVRSKTWPRNWLLPEECYTLWENCSF